MEMTLVQDVVVGLDGSTESSAALCFAVAVLPERTRLHAVHVIRPVEELARDAVLSDSVRDRHRREADLADCWLAPARESGLDVRPRVSEGAIADTLMAVADEVGADAIVVGHHARAHVGPGLVGAVTGDLLHHAERPVIMVPDSWRADDARSHPVVVGVGVARGTRAAIRWALGHTDVGTVGLSLVHALGPRSVFRPDGLLDVIAYHIDPSVLSEWIENDLTELAEEVREESGADDVSMSVTVSRGRTGQVLVEAGRTASLLVIGRGEPAFVRRHTIAPFLRHAIVDAPCPIAVIPAGEES